MKYPYIGVDNCGKIYLMLSGSNAVTMDSDSFTHTPMEEGGYTNITQEYLANTYGEVVSPEHAEFIVELAEGAGLEVIKWPSNQKMFSIRETYGKLTLNLIGDGFPKSGLKQITIPLPPKQIQTATPEEEFEMKQIMKNAGDNLVLGCESQLPKSNAKTGMPNAKECKGDEWPNIGDEVLVFSSVRRLAEIKGETVKVIGKCFHSDGSTIITVEHSSLGVFAVAKESCIKPKTPEEELRDDIMQTIHDDVYHGAYGKQSFEVFADALMSKYNITKKPQ